MNEAFAIIGSCINCSGPGNLLATLAVILIGVALAARFEARRPALARSKRAAKAK